MENLKPIEDDWIPPSLESWKHLDACLKLCFAWTWSLWCPSVIVMMNCWSSSCAHNTKNNAADRYTIWECGLSPSCGERPSSTKWINPSKKAHGVWTGVDFDEDLVLGTWRVVWRPKRVLSTQTHRYSDTRDIFSGPECVWKRENEFWTIQWNPVKGFFGLSVFLPNLKTCKRSFFAQSA